MAGWIPQGVLGGTVWVKTSETQPLSGDGPGSYDCSFRLSWRHKMQSDVRMQPGAGELRTQG